MSKTNNAKKAGVGLALACAVAAPFEGFRNWAYSDPVGIPTACFGTTKGVKLGQYYTDEQCHALLNKEMTEAVEAVIRCVPHDMTENQIAAFGSAVYNIGPKLVCDQRNSTAARLLANGQILEACEQLTRWSRARVGGVSVELPGLVKRRSAERDLCRS